MKKIIELWNKIPKDYQRHLVSALLTFITVLLSAILANWETLNIDLLVALVITAARTTLKLILETILLSLKK